MTRAAPDWNRLCEEWRFFHFPLASLLQFIEAADYSLLLLLCVGQERLLQLFLAPRRIVVSGRLSARLRAQVACADALLDRALALPRWFGARLSIIKWLLKNARVVPQLQLSQRDVQALATLDDALPFHLLQDAGARASGARPLSSAHRRQACCAKSLQWTTFGVRKRSKRPP